MHSVGTNPGGGPHNYYGNSRYRCRYPPERRNKPDELHIKHYYYALGRYKPGRRPSLLLWELQIPLSIPSRKEEQT
jgi:hypothetical protein